MRVTIPIYDMKIQQIIFTFLLDYAIFYNDKNNHF